MTGILTTSFGGVATCSKESSAKTIQDLFEDVRYSNGVMGSVNIAAYSSISAGWYNYLYIPHRSGGRSGDNYKYGTLILIGMTVSNAKLYVINLVSGNIGTLIAY